MRKKRLGASLALVVALLLLPGVFHALTDEQYRVPLPKATCRAKRCRNRGRTYGPPSRTHGTNPQPDKDGRRIEAPEGRGQGADREGTL